MTTDIPVVASIPSKSSVGEVSVHQADIERSGDRRMLRVFLVAGAGELGFQGDHGLATKARLWFATSVAVDQDGSVFIADTFNNRVRRVDARTGGITTVAGTGEQGFSGDGGLATEARLNSPAGLALDAKGNLFIADTFNNRVRVVDARTGIIFTAVATGEPGDAGDGGLAVKAQLTEPTGLAFDHDGNLLIADRGNHRVRKFDRNSMTITTIAGSGTAGVLGDGGPALQAQLNNPTALAVSPDGAIIIADTFNNRIRRLDPVTNIITTLAGNGEEGFDGDGGPAAKAQLMQPSGVVIGEDGSIYIADTYNNRIRRVDPQSGIISTLAGTDHRGLASDGLSGDIAPLNTPMGIARDLVGNLLIADSGNHRVLRLMP